MNVDVSSEIVIDRSVDAVSSYAADPAHAPEWYVTLRNRGTPAGFSRWVAPFMAAAMRRANRKDLVLLKKILEGRR